MTFAPWIPEKICQLQSRSLRHVAFVLSWRAKKGQYEPASGLSGALPTVPPDPFPAGSIATQGSGRKTGLYL
jgi:hypothetical protein